jgi:hypothetical protein
MLKKFFAENGLLIVFTALFLACLAGQMLSGHALYDSTQRHAGKPVDSMLAYVCTGPFLQGMFSNWQAAILQLGSLIVFGIFLRQRGAPHSLPTNESSTEATQKKPAQKAEKTRGKAQRKPPKSCRRTTAGRTVFCTITPCPSPLAFSLSLRSCWTGSRGERPTTRNVRSCMKLRFRARNSSFRRSSGSRRCRPGKRSTWRLRCMFSCRFFCASEAPRNLKTPTRRTPTPTTRMTDR